MSGKIVANRAKKVVVSKEATKTGGFILAAGNIKEGHFGRWRLQVVIDHATMADGLASIECPLLPPQKSDTLVFVISA